MSLKVKSEEDTLGFDHMKKPACEGRRKCARVSVTLSFGIRMWHAHSDVHTPPSEIRTPSQQERDGEPLLLNLFALCYLLLTPFTWLLASRTPCI